MQTIQALEVHVNATVQEALLPSLCQLSFLPGTWLHISHTVLAAFPVPLSSASTFLTNAITIYPGLQAENNGRAPGFFMFLHPLSLLHPTPPIASEGRKHLRSWDPDPQTRRDCQEAPDMMQGPNLALSSSGKTTSLCRGWGTQRGK